MIIINHNTLVYGNKAKPSCTAIRASSKNLIVILYRNKAKLVALIFYINTIYNFVCNKTLEFLNNNY